VRESSFRRHASARSASPRGNLPTTGLNAVVVLDQPAAAGSAHTAIANQITDSGPGFSSTSTRVSICQGSYLPGTWVIRMPISLYWLAWRTSPVICGNAELYRSKLRCNPGTFCRVADCRRPVDLCGVAAPACLNRLASVSVTFGPAGLALRPGAALAKMARSSRS
jgi:hypothetical protein